MPGWQDSLCQNVTVSLLCLFACSKFVSPLTYPRNSGAAVGSSWPTHHRERTTWALTSPALRCVDARVEGTQLSYTATRRSGRSRSDEMDVNKWGRTCIQGSLAGHHKGQPVAAACKARRLQASRKTGMHLFLYYTHTYTHTCRQIQTHSDSPTGNNHHPLTRESWWCSLCCRRTRRTGWCWLLYERPSAWLSRGLWYHRNSQSHRGSSQNWNTQNKRVEH